MVVAEYSNENVSLINELDVCVLIEAYRMRVATFNVTILRK